MKCVVIKLGTGLLSAGNGEIRSERISQICSGIELIKKQGIEVILGFHSCVRYEMVKNKKPSLFHSV